MNRTIRVMAVVCLLALAAPAFGQYYYLPGGNFVVPAEPWRRATDGNFYPSEANKPDGVILYGPDYYWSGGRLVPEDRVPQAEYYDPYPYHPRNDSGFTHRHNEQHFREHYRGGRP